MSRYRLRCIDNVVFNAPKHKATQQTFGFTTTKNYIENALKLLRNVSVLLKAARTFHSKRKVGNITLETRASMRAAFVAFEQGNTVLPEKMPIPWCIEKLRIVCLWTLNSADSDEDAEKCVTELQQPAGVAKDEEWSDFVVSLLEDSFDSMIKGFDTTKQTLDDLEALRKKLMVLISAAIARGDLLESHVKIFKLLLVALDPSIATTAEMREATELIDSATVKLLGPFKAWSAGKKLVQQAYELLKQGRNDDTLLEGFDSLAQDLQCVSRCAHWFAVLCSALSFVHVVAHLCYLTVGS